MVDSTSHDKHNKLMLFLQHDKAFCFLKKQKIKHEIKKINSYSFASISERRSYPEYFKINIFI